MSSIPRILSGLPLLPGTQAVTKVKGNRTITRAQLPNGNTEISIVESTPLGRKLKKAIFSNENSTTTLYPEKGKEITYDKRSGRTFVAHA